MASGTERVVGDLFALSDLRRIGTELVGKLLLLRKVLGQVLHVLTRERLRDGRHQRILAPAFLEIAQLEIEITCAQAGKRWPERIDGIAVGTVAGSARLSLFFDGSGVRERQCRKESKRKR